MSRTYRRLSHSYDFHYCGNGWLYSYIKKLNESKKVDEFANLDREIVRYFSDHRHYNSSRLSTTDRKMMRKESRTRLNQKTRDFFKSCDWDNFCTMKYENYSNPWSYD
ncbi:MAG TPA: hypothetical protein VKR58_13195 [Aquella sp.]|nr:hypothetical protein [Aquella sp.]